MRPNTNVLFLPGASGASEFWQPVAERLPARWSKTLLSWPGAGDQPHDPLVQRYEDLVELAASQLGEKSDLVAQSMGGVIAVGLALRYPERVGRIVLATTSGGIDVTGWARLTGASNTGPSSLAPRPGCGTNASITPTRSRQSMR